MPDERKCSILLLLALENIQLKLFGFVMLLLDAYFVVYGCDVVFALRKLARIPLLSVNYNTMDFDVVDQVQMSLSLSHG